MKTHLSYEIIDPVSLFLNKIIIAIHQDRMDVLYHELSQMYHQLGKDLSEIGMALSQRDYLGWTPLHHAVFLRKTRVCIQFGMDVYFIFFDAGFFDFFRLQICY